MKSIFYNFIICSASLLLISAAAKTVHAGDYTCDINGDGRLGLEEAVAYVYEISGMLADGPTDPLVCDAPQYEIPASGVLDPEAKRYILCRINKIRSEVALGLIADDGTNGYYPIATNMQRLQWDDNLAVVAQNHASKCIYEHNDGRDTHYASVSGIPNPSVGENIAARGISWTIDSTAAAEAIETAFSGWNGENDWWHYDTINQASWASGFGHFTQHVWAETTRVGCGQAWCPNSYPNNSNFNMIFTVCNFYIAGNWGGEYPYDSGTAVCSEDDMFPGDTCENGLITPADYITGIIYECDTDGDGELGLEEVINALLILSGSQ